MNTQTIKTELNKIRASVNFIEILIEPVIDPPITFPLPLLIGPVLKSSSTNVLFEPYTPVFMRNGLWIYYYYGWGQHLSCKSQSGVNLQSVDVSPTIGVHYGAISDLFNGKYYHCWHEWKSGRCLNHFASSTDGIVFTEYPVPEIWTGEDRSLMVDGNFLACYIRPKPPSQGRRTIGRMVSPNGTTWSEVIEVLAIDEDDFNDINSPNYHKELYSMSVCKVQSNEYWGVVNVYDPYLETVSVQLVHSTNGTDFTRFIQQPLIPIPTGIKQQYATINYVNGALRILVEQSSSLHGQATDERSRFELNVYRLELSDVRALI